MFGVLMSTTSENYGNYSCKYSHRISSSWALMLLVAKEQFLLFHQAKSIWKNVWAGCAPHLKHNSTEFRTTGFPFSLDLFNSL